ncbi:MAG TPA: ThuA domain-containing protein [Verrucomicrobiae bacterium]|nr:ThuA domain-containing protein [Verrucomicrobiae bacterium]
MRAYLVLLFFAATRIFCADVPHIIFVAGEYEYSSKETLPAFAQDLSREYNVKTEVLARPDDEKNQSIPGLEKLAHADLVILMVRRMTLPPVQLTLIKKYLESGKPLIGLRTASHSFENWKEFDHLVLGGNYQNHHGNQFKPEVTILPEAREHPILRGVSKFSTDGSLYKNSPLQAGTTPLLLGTIPDKPPEPVAWTHEYNGARIFYTSLGHPNDFKNESFRTLLRNSIDWALKEPLAKRHQP